jgi:hypothetical protein
MTTPVWAGTELATSVLALVALVVLHLLPTGLSPIHNAVSQYGITRYRQGYRVLTVGLGVAGLAAAALVAERYPRPGRAVIVALLVLFGLCRLVISWFPMDRPGTPRTGRGAAHLALAAGAFLSIALVANRMQRAAGHALGDGYRNALAVAAWLLLLGLLGLLITGRFDPRHRYFGAAERLIYAGSFLLLIATGLRLR